MRAPKGMSGPRRASSNSNVGGSKSTKKVDTVIPAYLKTKKAKQTMEKNKASASKKKAATPRSSQVVDSRGNVSSGPARPRRSTPKRSPSSAANARNAAMARARNAAGSRPTPARPRRAPSRPTPMRSATTRGRAPTPRPTTARRRSPMAGRRAAMRRRFPSMRGRRR